MTQNLLHKNVGNFSSAKNTRATQSSEKGVTDKLEANFVAGGRESVEKGNNLTENKECSKMLYQNRFI